MSTQTLLLAAAVLAGTCWSASALVSNHDLSLPDLACVLTALLEADQRCLIPAGVRSLLSKEPSDTDAVLDRLADCVTLDFPALGEDLPIEIMACLEKFARGEYDVQICDSHSADYESGCFQYEFDCEEECEWYNSDLELDSSCCNCVEVQVVALSADDAVPDAVDGLQTGSSLSSGAEGFTPISIETIESVVDAIRSRYPAELRAVFPRFCQAAAALLDHLPDLGLLARPPIVRALHRYGIVFDPDQYIQRVPFCADDFIALYSLLRAAPHAHLFDEVDVVLRAGRYDLIEALFESRQFRVRIAEHASEFVSWLGGTFPDYGERVLLCVPDEVLSGIVNDRCSVSGKTLLHFAVDGQQLEAIRHLLVAPELDPHVVDNDQHTALHYLKWYRAEQLAHDLHPLSRTHPAKFVDVVGSAIVANKIYLLLCVCFHQGFRRFFEARGWPENTLLDDALKHFRDRIATLLCRVAGWKASAPDSKGHRPDLLPDAPGAIKMHIAPWPGADVILRFFRR